MYKFYSGSFASAIAARDRARLVELQPGRDAQRLRQRARRFRLLHASRADARKNRGSRGPRRRAARKAHQHALPLRPHGRQRRDRERARLHHHHPGGRSEACRSLDSADRVDGGIRPARRSLPLRRHHRRGRHLRRRKLRVAGARGAGPRHGCAHVLRAHAEDPDLGRRPVGGRHGLRVAAGGRQSLHRRGAGRRSRRSRSSIPRW